MNEELLIVLVSEYKEIYDTGDHRYHDEQRRKNIWTEIGAILKQSPAECRDKWKRIRDNYRRARKLRQTKSGQAADKLKLIRYEKELQFLNQYICNEEETLTNLPTSVIDDDNENEQNISPPPTPNSIQSESSSNSHRMKRKKIAPSIGTPATSTTNLFQSYLENKYSQQNKEVDTLVEFFTNLGKTVNTFPENIQIRTKGAVFKIVNDAEAEVLQRSMGRCSQPATVLVPHERDFQAASSRQKSKQFSLSQTVSKKYQNTQKFEAVNVPVPPMHTYSLPSPLRTNSYIMNYDETRDSTTAEIEEFLVLSPHQNE